MGLRLHLGCGNHLKEGYINIDQFNPRADVQLALQDLYYPDNSVELLEAYMVIEHLSPQDAETFMKKSYQMLQPGGRLVLECPDLEKVSRLTLVFAEDVNELRNGPFGLRGIFAEPTETMTSGDYHKWGYTPALMRSILMSAGFSEVRIEDGTSHGYPIRDMRATATKGGANRE